jgi:hypothetical protein
MTATRRLSPRHPPPLCQKPKLRQQTFDEALGTLTASGFLFFGSRACAALSFGAVGPPALIRFVQECCECATPSSRESR